MKPLIRPMKAVSLLSPSEEHSDDNILKALEKLKYPVLATLKVDGIRAVRTTDLMSCRNKMIPNESIRRRTMDMPYGFDMELYNPSLQYDEIESIVMSREHERSNEIQFHMIDGYDDLGYEDRINRVAILSDMSMYSVIIPYLHYCPSAQTLLDFFLLSENQEGEGICFRTPDSPYKQGRSTLNEQYLVKLCRYVREEVTIVGFVEQELNTNKQTTNSTGLSERSSANAGKKGKDTLGAFLVKDKNGLEFRVGTGVGLTESRRQSIWNNRDCYHNKQITIKHKPHGQKLKPRSPVIVGFRDTTII